MPHGCRSSLHFARPEKRRDCLQTIAARREFRRKCCGTHRRRKHIADGYDDGLLARRSRVIGVGAARELVDRHGERLNKVFRAAGPFPFRVTTHILRHTFIRVHLTRGTDINVIAELAGDTPDIIRKHYAEWVPERQNRLTKILKESYYARLEAQAGRGRVVNIRKAQ